MTICTFIADCGPLGEVELTVSYRYAKGRRATQIDPAEPETAHINWIKIGGINGIEVVVADDYITEEIVPACVDDWKGEDQCAAEAYADEMRERQRMAA